MMGVVSISRTLQQVYDSQRAKADESSGRLFDFGVPPNSRLSLAVKFSAVGRRTLACYYSRVNELPKRDGEAQWADD